jgi:hypothetical protein
LVDDTTNKASKLDLQEIEGPIKKFFSTICQELDDHFLNTLEIVIETLVKMKNKSEDHYKSAVKFFMTKFIIDNLGSYSQNKVKCVRVLS